MDYPRRKWSYEHEQGGGGEEEGEERGKERRGEREERIVGGYKY
jgi:hypothetical protein